MVFVSVCTPSGMEECTCFFVANIFERSFCTFLCIGYKVFGIQRHFFATGIKHSELTNREELVTIACLLCICLQHLEAQFLDRRWEAQGFRVPFITIGVIVRFIVIASAWQAVQIREGFGWGINVVSNDSILQSIFFYKHLSIAVCTFVGIRCYSRLQSGIACIVNIALQTCICYALYMIQQCRLCLNKAITNSRFISSTHFDNHPAVAIILSLIICTHPSLAMIDELPVNRYRVGITCVTSCNAECDFSLL